MGLGFQLLGLGRSVGQELGRLLLGRLAADADRSQQLLGVLAQPLGLGQLAADLVGARLGDAGGAVSRS